MSWSARDTSSFLAPRCSDFAAARRFPSTSRSSTPRVERRASCPCRSPCSTRTWAPAAPWRRATDRARTEPSECPSWCTPRRDYRRMPARIRLLLSRRRRCARRRRGFPVARGDARHTEEPRPDVGRGGVRGRDGGGSGPREGSPGGGESRHEQVDGEGGCAAQTSPPGTTSLPRVEARRRHPQHHRGDAAGTREGARGAQGQLRRGSRGGVTHRSFGRRRGRVRGTRHGAMVHGARRRRRARRRRARETRGVPQV